MLTFRDFTFPKAGRLAVGAQKRVGHKDKRNLYLADEGLVVQDSGAAEGAAKSDLEKRVQARRDKKTKLKNPVRLCMCLFVPDADYCGWHSLPRHGRTSIVSFTRPKKV